MDLDDAPQAVLPVPDGVDAATVEAAIARGPPATAEDYLLRVRYEAAALPDSFIADSVPVSRAATAWGPPASQAKQAKRSDTRPAAASAWQSAVTAEFVALRAAVARRAAACRAKSPSLSDDALEALCWQCADGRSPQLTPVASMQQRDVVRAIGLWSDCWALQDEPAPPSRLAASWLHALLAAIEQPLLSDTEARLYGISELCLKLRDGCEASEVAVLDCLSVFCAYFGQIADSVPLL